MFVKIPQISKHLWWSLFLKETPTQVFSREICEIFENTYFEEHLQTTACGVYILEQIWTGDPTLLDYVFFK